MEHKPIICRRCTKEIADADQEAALVAARALENLYFGDKEALTEAEKTKIDFAKKFCVCRPSDCWSEFTSRPQPPNLDSIERRVERGRARREFWGRFVQRDRA
jgi:hypothetical protein